ncbi:MAG TPA: cellulose biosynthesis cyclic di-GMP-binding regulatory protein BcsB [Pseudogracilibacillus sp.]|nr:cellulose biosynthesis cyclic di-GMP-binding regulatory protein BcsB [Pseudogracilibacillus sp.]
MQSKALWRMITMAILAFFIVPTFSEAADNNTLQMKGKLAVKTSKTERTPLFNESIQLYGLEQERTLFYEVFSKPLTKKNELVLNIEYSELLVSPSSITVSVDGKPLVTKALQQKKPTTKVVVPLQDDTLKKGVHEVTISFYGVIKEGMCVVQESTGNWLSIRADSYIQLGQQKMKDIELSHYPKRFIGTKDHQTTVVIPKKASEQLLSSSLQLATYLQTQSEGENRVAIRREQEVAKHKITGNIVLIGEESAFESSFAKKLLKQVGTIEKDALTLSTFRLQDGKQQVNALVVTADTAEAIQQRMHVLLEDEMIQQLSGSRMVIQTMPSNETKQEKFRKSFKQLGIQDVTLNHIEPETETFFFYAPTTIRSDGKTMLTLRLKLSETIQQSHHLTEEVLQDDEVTLTIYVNERPHSIDVRNLEQQDNGLYTVQIPIDAKQDQNQRLVSLKIQSNGLKRLNPCYTTDAERWILIDDTSFMTFSDDEQASLGSFSHFPYPYAAQETQTTIVLPNGKTSFDDDVFTLLKGLSVQNEVLDWTITRSKDLTEEQLESDSLIFLGGIEAHEVLKEHAEDLLVSYDQQRAQLAEHGFLEEAVAQYSWIQESPWNHKNVLTIFSTKEQDGKLISEALLAQLKQTNERATIAVKLNNGDIYTNAETVDETFEPVHEQVETKKDENILWYLIAFGGLLLVTLFTLVIAMRKRKRKKE